MILTNKNIKKQRGEYLPHLSIKTYKKKMTFDIHQTHKDDCVVVMPNFKTSHLHSFTTNPILSKYVELFELEK